MKFIHLFLSITISLITINAKSLFAQEVQIIPFIKQGGGRIDWAQEGIVYDHLNLNTYYSISIIQPNGSGYKDLTKNKPGCPQKNNGQPVFYPSGRYMVFQAEKDVNFDSADVHFGPSLLSNPGSGIDCDLWVLDMQRSVFTRLTNIPTKKTFSDTTKYTGVLHPQFSHDGRKLLWGECIDGSGGNGFGLWRLNISDFDTTGGFPQLINTVHYDSGGVLGHFTFIETSGGFSPNDSTIIYCANAIAGLAVEDMDIYSFNFYTQQLSNLTPDAGEYDEHSHFSYDGQRVLWMSSRNVKDDSIANAKTEFWLMNSDGSNKVQLTYFNDSTSADYKTFCQKGRVISSDNTWSPFGGDTALCYLQVYDSAGAYHQQDVFLVIPHNITSVAVPPVDDNIISCYPDPASTVLTLTGIKNVNTFNVEVYNLEGRLLYKSKNELAIDVASLASGMYYLKVYSEGFNRVMKFEKI